MRLNGAGEDVFAKIGLLVIEQLNHHLAVKNVNTHRCEQEFLIAFDFVLCPLTVLSLALHETLRGRSYAALGFLGDISYSTYLIHFPMQLTLALVAARFALEPQFFMQGWVMLAFYAVLIALGWLSYRYFERPLQSLLRNSSKKALPAEG